MNTKQDNKTVSGPHNLSLENRKNLTMTGIKEVVTFNEDKVILQTNQGNLDIKGSELNIQQLNLEDGSIKINGYISSLEYNERVTKKGILNRLFK